MFLFCVFVVDRFCCTENRFIQCSFCSILSSVSSRHVMDREINLATKDETIMVAACWLRKYISKTSRLHVVMADIIGKFTIDIGVIHLPFKWLDDVDGYSVSNEGKRFVKSHKSSAKCICANQSYTHDGVYTRWSMTLKRRKKHRSLEFMMGFLWKRITSN